MPITKRSYKKKSLSKRNHKKSSLPKKTKSHRRSKKQRGGGSIFKIFNSPFRLGTHPSQRLPIRTPGSTISNSEYQKAELKWLSDNLNPDVRAVLGDYLDNQIQDFGMYDYPPSKKNWEQGIKDLIHLQQAVEPGMDLGEFSTTSQYFSQGDNQEFTVYNPQTDRFYPPTN